MSLVIAVDFDGTLVADRRPLTFRPGAREGLLAMKKAGHHLILFTARATPLDEGPELANEVERFYAYGEIPVAAEAQWRRFNEMRSFLQQVGMWSAFDEVWQSPGKPHADIFVDDRFQTPDWLSIIREFGVR